MAWRKILSLFALAIALGACSFPVQISFLSGETPAPESKALSTSAADTSGAAHPQVAGNENVTQQALYQVQAGTPVGVVNFVDPTAGCSWTGVGGQVFGLNGEPVVDLVAELGGNFGGKQLSQLAVTGRSQVLGPGGYLIVFGDQPAASQGTLWLQLFDQEGAAVSDKVFFDTYSGCERNLTLVNFIERYVIQSTTLLPYVGNQRLYYYFPFVGQK